MSDSTAAGVAKARHIESLAPEATRNVAQRAEFGDGWQCYTN